MPAGGNLPGAVTISWIRRLHIATGAAVLLACTAALVVSCQSSDDGPNGVQSCSVDEDCELGFICDNGGCLSGCREDDSRCPAGRNCVNGQCCPPGCDGEPQWPDGGTDAAASCPVDMQWVDDRFCMDRYEASRPNATASSTGSDESYATSRPGVLPWFPVTLNEARNACGCAGKRLCAASEFLLACQGPRGTVYPYGDQYDPLICNGIDTYCRCSPGSVCGDVSPCPYPHCYNQPPPGSSSPPAGCGAAQTAMPTGAFPDCVNEYGVYDLSGNVWELVDDGSFEGQFRGGAYNCRDSETLHRCDYVAGDILARGFRCCL